MHQRREFDRDMDQKVGDPGSDSGFLIKDGAERSGFLFNDAGPASPRSIPITVRGEVPMAEAVTKLPVRNEAPQVE